MSSLWRCLMACIAMSVICGCGHETPAYPLDPDLARASVQKAMQAWTEGKSPSDLKPEMIVGDSAWISGKRLSSFQIVAEEETSDGSNLHIRVIRRFDSAESKVTYIVGTSPVITIFPQ